MLRAIIRRRFRDSISGATVDNQLYTIDFESPELEAELRAGGFGESGFDVRELIGVEVVRHCKPSEEPTK